MSWHLTRNSSSSKYVCYCDIHWWWAAVHFIYILLHLQGMLMLVVVVLTVLVVAVVVLVLVVGAGVLVTVVTWYILVDIDTRHKYCGSHWKGMHLNYLSLHNCVLLFWRLLFLGLMIYLQITWSNNNNDNNNGFIWHNCDETCDSDGVF